MDFLNNLPRGKDDKPFLLIMGETLYDINEVDGQRSMLDREFSGCIVVSFSKPMDPSIIGTASVNGQKLKQGKLASFAAAHNLWMYGIPVQGVLTEYDKEYIIHVEGFVDHDGNTMDPYDLTVQTLKKQEPKPEYAENDQVALEAAREGIVLLKNEGNVLPLNGTEELNIFGKGYYQFRVTAVGAGRINPRYTIGLREALEKESSFKVNLEVANLYCLGEDVVPSDKTMDDAKLKSDIAIITITRKSGENIDNAAIKGEYYLTDSKEKMIQAISEKFDNTIAIINSGYPIDVSWVEKYNIKSVLVCGYAGMLGGKALVEILDGRVNPSAKLPDTWSEDYYDIPASKNFIQPDDENPIIDGEFPKYIDTVYEEDIYVGYRYFDIFNKDVAYPFGFGLSYTNFKMDINTFQYTNQIELSIDISNIGEYSGKEVVQVYVEAPQGKLEKPSKVLVDFDKTKELKVNESQKINFEIPNTRFTSYDESTAAYILEKGDYKVYVGNSVKNVVLAGKFVLLDDIIVKQVKNRMSPVQDIVTLSQKDPVGTYPTGKFSGIKENVENLEPAVKRDTGDINLIINDKKSDKVKDFISYEDIEKNPELVSDFVSQLDIEELARLSVCASSGWGVDQKGEAGRVFLLDKYKMKDFVVADGNNGVNLVRPNIGMPSSCMVCSSFNKSLAYEVGKVIAKEAIENDIQMILAPALNLHRNPLNGRHPEYFSEDPYLAGTMAGFQCKGLEENGVSASVKHTIANNCEAARKRNQSIITERAIREIYIRAFEFALDIQIPDSIMTAYNAVNGCFTSCDGEMIQGIFREELGFEGFVMTDWGCYDTADVVEAIQAGNCWLTPGSEDDTFVTPIVEGVKDGRIDMARLQENVMYLLKVMIKRTKQ